MFFMQFELMGPYLGCINQHLHENRISSCLVAEELRWRQHHKTRRTSMIGWLLAVAVMMERSECVDSMIQPSVTNEGIKASKSQVLRAAGSQSLQKLKDVLATGWTRDELDSSEGDKAAVHMAAWQGCLENLSYLVDEIGCDVNTIAKSKFAYGKTPIFFACTRSRAEQVRFLLDRKASVKIVNNKGQSVLSIASSHFTDSEMDIVRRIEKAEQDQANIPWNNYRESHSDGLEYGDQDPRFLDRPLRPSDNVTEYAVNPTNKKIRKGNFLRNNPHLDASESKAPVKQKKRSPRTPRALSEEEATKLDALWDELAPTLTPEKQRKGHGLLRQILKISDQQQRSWIGEAATKLETMWANNESNNDSGWEGLVLWLRGCQSDDRRETTLIEKLVTSVGGDDREGVYGNDSQPPKNVQKPNHRASHSEPNKVSLNEGQWPKAVAAATGLSFSNLIEKAAEVEETPSSSPSYVLGLDKPAIWVDSVDQIQQLQDKLEVVELVAMDTEWAANGEGKTIVATVQFAAASLAGQSSIDSYVVDLIDAESNQIYNACVRQFLENLFSTKLILGFAVGNDLSKLEATIACTLSRRNVLDLQRLWDRRQPPSLAKCAGFYHTTATLDKGEQCSDWRQRPLKPEQLEYAALDAAVLLILLAEKSRETNPAKASS